VQRTFIADFAMSENVTLFAKTPRGRPLVGPRAIARHIWDNPEKWRSVYRLDRHTYGIVVLPGGLTAYEGCLDAALARAAGGERPCKAEA
jgi:hypothetical protein